VQKHMEQAATDIFNVGGELDHPTEDFHPF
jgi:hypothetical protein